MSLSSFFFFFLLLFNFLFLFNLQPSIAQQQQPALSSFNISFSPWRPTQNRYLLSPNSNFSAGFFPIPNSSNLFTFSVWFSKVPKTANPLVWNATTTTPLKASSSLVITPNGQILLNGSPLGNASGDSNSTQLLLRDDGNLVFGNWQSFDNPTNTILPNQNINGTVLNSNNGEFKFVNSTSLVLNSTSDKYYSTPNPLVIMDDAGKMNMVDNSFLPSDYGDSRFRKLVLDDDGDLRIYGFYSDQNQWKVVWRGIWEMCTIIGRCGPYAICTPTDDLNPSTSCVCPSGFRPNRGGPENGCKRNIPLSSNTNFLRLDYVNYTSRGQVKPINAENFTSCESTCKTDPNCLGFGFKYDGSRYCVALIGKELVYGYWSPGTETALFLKVDQSESEDSNFVGLTDVMQTTCPVNISLPLPPKDSNSTTRNIVIICTLFAAELIAGVAFFWSFLKRYIKYRDMATTLGLELLPAGGPKRFTYSELKAATNDFSSLIGRGGFGDVYKGELPDHRIVAVKCLKNVAGGDAEFWAEVTIIARMHHLNLVRLWGFCAEKGQRILVYEYIPGGSLDKYLFRSNNKKSSNPDSDTHEKPVLDWSVRYRIALGMARAIAYLHEECLEWVLHCDIKPENILLGDDFCPKISDFGLAKLRKKEDMVTMSRRRGTPGYMAPEWITAEPITSKADVYSFGMVLLELVSGVRNFEIQGSLVRSEEWYFPGWAFDKMFKEMKVEDILDGQIRQLYDSRAHFELVNRMVKTAMWCLQDRPELRPTMGKVAKMLEGTVEITEPKKPTVFFLGEE